MTLDRVLEGVPLAADFSPELAGAEVRGLAYDSRKVERGFLFFAFPGAKVDGAQFANAAIEKGALAVVSDRPAPAGLGKYWLQTPHGRYALASASKNFFGRPDERLRVTAITGTNGKTTSTLLMDSIFRESGKITALVGTVEYHLAGRVLPAVNTTPESLDLFTMMNELEQACGAYFTFEASSHALDLGRVHGITVHTAGFTNFTRDHLDYHGTMEAYFAAKQLLFTPRTGPPPRFAVLNSEDESSARLKIASETNVYWYGDHPPRSSNGRTDDVWVRAESLESSFEGLRFRVNAGKTPFAVESALVGHINVSNILLASAVALTYGIPEERIMNGLRNLRNIPGRFERVEEGQPFMVVVDYAHTEDALRNTISVARGMKPNRIITMFGCGGDRDRSKRPLMGMAAAELSDFVVLTSDNPRSEDPLAIMNDAMVGLSRSDTPHTAEPDREKAVRKAIETAEPGDIVILAGKGHETYQILKDGPIPFDDREIARRVLKSFGYSGRAQNGNEKRSFGRGVVSC